MTVHEELLQRLLPVIKSDESYLLAIQNCAALKESCLHVYRGLRPIEELPPSEKKSIWQYVRSRHNGTLESQIEFAKIVYTIGNLM